MPPCPYDLTPATILHTRSPARTLGRASFARARFRVPRYLISRTTCFLATITGAIPPACLAMPTTGGRQDVPERHITAALAAYTAFLRSWL